MSDGGVTIGGTQKGGQSTRGPDLNQLGEACVIRTAHLIARARLTGYIVGALTGNRGNQISQKVVSMLIGEFDGLRLRALVNLSPHMHAPYINMPRDMRLSTSRRRLDPRFERVRASVR